MLSEMPIALGRRTIHRSGFGVYDAGDLLFAAEQEDDLGSCSSSSIGRNSDDSGGSSSDEESGETEVQSSFKGPLDTMDVLEEVLPMKRGISSFYSGKSKSFTSLADAAAVSTIKDITKPEDPYTKKRKSLLAHSQYWDKNLRYSLKNKDCGMSKRPANSCRSMSSCESNSTSEDSNSVSSSPSCPLPPLHPHGKRTSANVSSSSSSPPPPRRNTPWRSFSLSDLHCVAAASPNLNGFAICDGGHESNGVHR